ncbi:MAG: bifunctional diaminohydroxyphosphoribosylaminopyrimidine deaminase/5-amino-6-(5-phosphoribosylamino)uracil reductase RibD [Candidatus Baltobacteraceae bacterium]
MAERELRLTPIDELYLRRAYELAARGLGSTMPNPPVGAVVVRDGRIVGEGYHHRAGEAHAETNALAQAGPKARGATIYISLEPCRHIGRTPPCTLALLEAGITRVVAGTIDPSRNGGGAADLEAEGVDVVIAEEPAARELIEAFARASAQSRPYVALKMAMSLDGCIATRPGVREQITSEGAARYVRELRIAYDAVMVGAETVRVDDPQLTVRPAHDRARIYRRVVACEKATLPPGSRIFAGNEGYAKTIVLAPAGASDRFDDLRGVADVVYVGERDARRLDLARAMEALRERGIYSVLCEGGPRLGAQLIATGVVDRFYWAIAPVLLQNDRAAPVLAGADLAASGTRLHFDRVERTGDDVVLSGTFERV